MTNNIKIIIKNSKIEINYTGVPWIGCRNKKILFSRCCNWQIGWNRISSSVKWRKFCASKLSIHENTSKGIKGWQSILYTVIKISFVLCTYLFYDSTFIQKLNCDIKFASLWNRFSVDSVLNTHKNLMYNLELSSIIERSPFTIPGSTHFDETCYIFR